MEVRAEGMATRITPAAGGHFWLWLGLGVALGAWLHYSAASLVVVLLFFLILYCLGRSASPDERGFLLKTLALGFGVKLLLAAVLYHAALWTVDMEDFFGDAHSNASFGLYISQVLQGVKEPQASAVAPYSWLSWEDLIYWYDRTGGQIPVSQYRVNIFVYFMGIFYALFGYSPLALKFLTALLFTLAALSAYLIAKELFDLRVARITLVGGLFFPSLLFWSSTGLIKDGASSAAAGLSLLLLVRMAKRPSWSLGGLILLTILAAYAVRPFWGYTTGSAAAFLLIVLALKRLRCHTISILALFLAISILLPIFMPSPPSPLQKGRSLYGVLFESLWALHYGYIITGGSTYRFWPERYYADEDKGPREISLSESAWTTLKGVFHLLTQPHPWAARTAAQLAGIPVVTLWYGLLILAVFGLGRGLSGFSIAPWSALIFIALTLAIMGLAEGNVGTAVRHRGNLEPFLLVFSSAGLAKLLDRKGSLRPGGRESSFGGGRI